MLVIDRDNWKLYELGRAFPINGGASWNVDCGAIFDLNTNALRPAGWTSADAAGLPIFPGLVRYDEVIEQGLIAHALRFTVKQLAPRLCRSGAAFCQLVNEREFAADGNARPSESLSQYFRVLAGDAGNSPRDETVWNDRR